MQCVKFFLLVLLTLTASALTVQAQNKPILLVRGSPVTVRHNPPFQGPGPQNPNDPYYPDTFGIRWDFPNAPQGAQATTQYYLIVAGYTDFLGTWHPFSPPYVIPLDIPPSTDTIGPGDYSIDDRDADPFALLAALGVPLPAGSTIGYNYTGTCTVTYTDSQGNTQSQTATTTSNPQSAPTPNNYKPGTHTGTTTSPFDPIGSTVIDDFPIRTGTIFDSTTNSTVLVFPALPISRP